MLEVICQNPKVEMKGYAPESKTFYFDKGVEREMSKALSDLEYEYPEVFERLKDATRRPTQRTYEVLVATALENEEDFVDNIEKVAERLEEKDYDKDMHVEDLEDDEDDEEEEEED